MSSFYVVQRDGIPAVWQVNPDGISALLSRKSKAGYSVVSTAPARSWSDAIATLRQLFPDSRRAKSHKQA